MLCSIFNIQTTREFITVICLWAWCKRITALCTNNYCRCLCCCLTYCSLFLLAANIIKSTEFHTNKINWKYICRCFECSDMVWIWETSMTRIQTMNTPRLGCLPTQEQLMTFSFYFILERHSIYYFQPTNPCKCSSFCYHNVFRLCLQFFSRSIQEVCSRYMWLS